MRFNLKKIPSQNSKIVLSPDSLRVRILNLKWELDDINVTYNEMRENNQQLFDYLGIIDDDTMRTKINDQVRYMDYPYFIYCKIEIINLCYHVLKIF